MARKGNFFARRRDFLKLSAGIAGAGLAGGIGLSETKGPCEIPVTADHVPLKVVRFPDSLPPLANVDGRLVRVMGNQIMVVEPWGKDGLRVRVSKAEIVDTAWALIEPVESSGSIDISGIEELSAME